MKALVLLSGGQDSTTCLYWAKEHYKEVVALNILYGQRHSVECESAKKIATLARVEYHQINLGNVFQQIGDSALLNSDDDVTAEHRAGGGLPASFVPGRNIILITFAAAFAFKRDITDIITGVCQTDYSGYPDCRHSTMMQLGMTLKMALDYPVSIKTPLMKKTKKETVIMASLMPGCWDALSYSHTCYNGQVPPCGKCPACELRAKGFAEANRNDPLVDRTKRKNES